MKQLLIVSGRSIIKTYPKAIEGLTKDAQINLQAKTEQRLRRSWFFLAFAWLVIWLISYRLLRPIWPSAERWLIISGLALIYCLGVFWRALPLNVRPGERVLLASLGLGNHLSLLRGLIIGLLAGFLFSPMPQMPLAWLIALLTTAASIIDGLDGYVARRRGQVTELGQQLDIEFDSFGVAVISFVAIGFGQLPPWFLGVALARYLFLLGLWWRQRNGRRVYEIPPSAQRRIMAGMMMGMLTVVLWPIVPAAMAALASDIIAVPLLLGFMRDWLFASGRLTNDNQRYLQLQRRLYLLMARRLPPIWRLSLTAAMLLVMGQAVPWYQPQAWQELLASWHVPFAPVLATGLVVLALLGTLSVLLGFAGRLGAILLFFPIGFDIATRGLLWDNGLALSCALCIALLGSGDFSLWQPEEALIARRGGETEIETVVPFVKE